MIYTDNNARGRWHQRPAQAFHKVASLSSQGRVEWGGSAGFKESASGIQKQEAAIKEQHTLENLG